VFGTIKKKRETKMDFSENDLRQLKESSIASATVMEQLERFERGISPVVVERSCTVGDGIRRPGAQKIEELRDRFQPALAQGRITKMVPASGAASRMFQSLSAVLERGDLPYVEDIRKQAAHDQQSRDTLTFLDNLERFPFTRELQEQAQKRSGDMKQELATGEYREILEDLLTSRGMNFPQLPKALLPFHSYDNHTRTAVEEHLQEALSYARDSEGVTRLHLTLSGEHQEIVEKVLMEMAHRRQLIPEKMEVTFSSQHAATDTIAVDMENQPFRDDDGKLLVRPGGHGALLKNLQELAGDIVFIKNIDNVAHERHLELTITYKQALGGLLLELQEQIFSRLELLTAPDISPEQLKEMFQYIRRELLLQPPAKIVNASSAVQITWLIARLNRPLRVCGLVRNEGEPGGGPFWVKDTTGMDTLQLVEMGQIDLNNEEQKSRVAASTHFSPVDLVCATRDFRGSQFELHHYLDPESGMIAEKSFQGRSLKALELPGLWNGGMAHWNTVFVEVPPLTFNPVKTILDLLRSPHQPQDQSL
jgi:hypothetical protein